jgi:uncharacterized protein YodC (DUF2158 family)
MSSFKAGDVVRLKSGGPGMTIDAIEGDQCVCLWFGNDNVELQPRHFMPHVLFAMPPEAKR